MKFSTLQIKYDADKLSALKQYTERKQVSVDDEITEALTKLYEKYVPAPVREYIDFNAQNESDNPAKPKKTATTAASTEASNNRPVTSGGIGSNN